MEGKCLLIVYRSYHSLTATPGMVFCTGGIRKHLKRRNFGSDDIDVLPDSNLGKIIEVYLLKQNLWIEYNDKLMASRYWHSSTILGSYLYLFLGYDVEHTVFNSVGIERLEISTNEARLFQNNEIFPKYVFSI